MKARHKGEKLRSGVTSSTGWPSWVVRNPALWCPEREVGKAPPLAPQLNHATAPLAPVTYEAAARGAGFDDFRWVDAMLEPTERDDPFWDDFLTYTPLTDLVAWIIPKNVLSLVFSTLGVVQMPHKFNAARRHKFDKVQYRVINWAEYNESLRQRGDLTIWVSEEAQSVWSAPRRTSRGGQRRYSDLAIETCLTLRTTYRLALRQTQGLMGSIGTLMGLDIRVPDYSTLSRRANGVSIAQVMRQAGSVPIHLVVDSTGLKIFGEGEWLAQKHKIKVIRRRWRKLHLGLDLASGAIVCADLTDDDAGDSTALPGLLDQLDAPVTGFLADGAYDGASTRDLLRERYGETLDVVIPPPKNAVIRPQSARGPTVRDRHIAQIRSNGRMAWQAATGYNQRSRIETQIGRWKSVIGPKLKSRSFSRQITEITVGQKVLNTRTACVRTHRLTLPLGKGRIPSPPRSMQQRCLEKKSFSRLIEL